PQQVGVITRVESRAEMSNGWNIFHFITRNNTRLEPLKVTTSTGTSFDITIINRKGEQLVGQQAELRPIQISEDDELIENGNYTYLYS
ncbi:hypothetical protein, partial [Pseudomonas marginalis]|uniref:hypothetical protein n=1 Tax=Pseudomonas marginalis TaxID=298 RepID=UPI002B1D4430